MKKLLAILLALLLLSACAAPTVYDGPTQSAWVLTEQIHTRFDEAGNTLETRRIVFSYDASGNQIRSLTYRDGELSTEYRYAYDDRGNRISSDVWDHSGLIPWPSSRTGYTYDSQNRPLDTIYRNFLGLERRRDTYTYDDTANTVTWEGVSDTITRWLDADGNVLRSLLHSTGGGISVIENDYEYDELGRNTEIRAYYDDAPASITSMTYDDQNRLLEEIYYDAAGTVYSHTTYQYGENTITIRDQDGCTTIKTLRPDGQVEKMEQYDKKGNLTALTQYIYQEIQIPAQREE